MTDLNDLLKQAKEMQEQMQKAQQEMAEKEVTGESGAGLVKVVMNGKHVVKKVTLDPSLMQEEQNLIEDLMAAATNDAVRKVEENNKNQLGGLMSGLNMPEGFKFPF
ncbi:MAG: YbaB/EbfC family nucleoid-associated protein [Gammaproteobacteria bacterium]|nr:YbaB/EbfC family nucleoid-associated protein [Gammaproteobacteria bacterium]